LLVQREGRHWLAGRLRAPVLAGLVLLAAALAASLHLQARELDAATRRGQTGWQEFQLGNAWLRLQQPDSARASYLRALAAAPTLPEVRLNLGLLAARTRPEVADSLFREELRVDPASAKAWNNLGSLRLAAGDLAAAREAFRQALELRPGLEDAAWNLGLVECRLGLEALHQGDQEAAAAALAAASATPYRGKGWNLLDAALP
jgi:tetratricopeptide (TPR) repeat protein